VVSKEQLPVPNSFPQSKENQQFSYVFMNLNVDGSINVSGRFAEGPSLDGKGQFTVMQNKPMGQEPVLASGPKEAHAQNEQMTGLLDKVKAAVLPS